MEVSTQYLMNAMQNFEKENPEAIKSVCNEESAEALVLQFLEYSKIEFIFKKDGIQEDKKADDLITYSRDMVSRLVLSLTFDRCEKEEDPVGMRGIRRIMIPYFLNRKSVVQDSKVIFAIHILGRINPLSFFKLQGRRLVGRLWSFSLPCVRWAGLVKISTYRLQERATPPLELRNPVHGTVHVIMTYSTVHSPSGKVLVMLNGIGIEKSNSCLPECRTAAA